jgi:hypothetical protein
MLEIAESDSHAGNQGNSEHDEAQLMVRLRRWGAHATWRKLVAY